MKFILTILLFFSFSALAQDVKYVLMNGYARKYQYHRTITIDHTKVPNTDQTDFPVVFTGTYSYLANTASAGKTRSLNGYDIVISYDSLGRDLVPFQMVHFVNTTGFIEMWFKISNLSHTTDSIYYLNYGRIYGTDTLDTKTTWNSGFKAVQHAQTMAPISRAMAEGTSNTTVYTAAVGSTFVAGKIDSAFSAAGGASPTGIAVSNMSSMSTFTISGWLFPIASSDSYGAIVSQANTRGLWYRGVSHKLAAFFDTPERNNTTALTESAWNHFALVANGTSLTYYLNGIADGNFSQTVVAATFSTMGDDVTSESYKGYIDEIHVSNVARSADWIKTEYNNQNSPSTFYTIGSEVQMP